MLPREELELLARLTRGEEAMARLRERAFYAAGKARNRPYLVEALAAAGRRTLAYCVHEPSLDHPATRPAAGAFAPADLSAHLLPLDSHAREDEFAVGGAKPVWALRVTLLGAETDILEAAAAGFAGVWGPATGRDLFALQYLVELARDLGLTYVPAVEDEAALDVLLRTDAPYVGFGRGFGETPESVLALQRALAPSLPKGSHVAVLLPSGAGPQHVRIALAAGAEAVAGPAGCFVTAAGAE